MFITTHNHRGSKSISLKVDLNVSTYLLVIHKWGVSKANPRCKIYVYQSIIINHFINCYQWIRKCIMLLSYLYIYCTLSTIKYSQSTISIIINYYHPVHQSLSILINHFLLYQSICKSILQLSYLYVHM